MGTVGFSISTQGAEDYRRLAKNLRQAGRKDLRSKLRSRITEAGKPVLEEVRSTVRGLPVTSTRGGGRKQRREFSVARAAEKSKDRVRRRGAGLRSTIASATKLQVTARGVRFIVNSNQLPADQQSLPRHLDSPKGWRHPVFGDSHTWVHQQGKPYFAVVIKRHAPDFRRAILKAMDEIQAEIET